MASKLIKAAAFAAIAVGLTIASIGFVSGIAPFVYAFIQGLTLKSASLYLSASALLTAPLAITPIRRYLTSSIKILISRLSWQTNSRASRDGYQEVFINKSPFPQIKNIGIKRRNDGYYEIEVTPANVNVYLNICATLASNGFLNLVKRENNLKLKTSNQTVISNFLYHVSKEAPEVRGMISRFKFKLEAVFAINVNATNSQKYLPAWVVHAKQKQGRNILTLINTRSYAYIDKIKLSSNGVVKLFHEGYFPERIRSQLNRDGTNFVENDNLVTITNISRLQLETLSRDFLGTSGPEGKIVNDFFDQHMRVNVAPQHPVGSGHEENVELDRVDAFQFTQHLNVENLTNEQRLEKLNEARKSKGLPEIDVPENYQCPIGLSLMDDPVYDERAPQRFDFSNIILSLNQKLENPFTRQPLYRDELKHDRNLQKEIKDFLHDLEHPKPQAKVAPPITPAAKRFKQTSRKKPEVEPNQAVESVATRSKHKK